ncbi:ABC transporter permease [Jiangella alba]|uniref:Monosaccharide ABC transporter membrane protein, CUT2 family n=1 Tax=Jiangella alba TaxID=561176 RepID=A0A1H5HJP3_9ACTN|nr:ABC transporter permease [Jiangella alba]SEE28080.1 monosaccharide ABC transporter membrane protein, CUT2 family [Jiangella alba]
MTALPLVSRVQLRRLAVSSTLYLAVALAVLIAVFTALEPDAFGSAYNVRTVLTGASILLVMAVGATFVIATAGIDLSVGAVLVFSGVVAVKVMDAFGGSGWGAVGAGFVTALAAGGAWGLLNGLLVTKARIPALIATLGTLGMALGLAQVITGGNDLGGVPGELVTTVGQGRLFGAVPWLVVAAVVVTALAAFALAKTRFGRYTLTIGSNHEAARRSGVRVDRHVLKVYALAGLLAGFAGFLSLARFASTTIAGHGTDNLQAITAVVLGGTSLFGGVATVIGTVIGVFIPAVLQNGFVILGVKPFWQQVAIGAVLVAAVYLDQLRRRARQRH